MSLFIRKLYYLRATGDVLVSYKQEGSFVMPTEDWDFQYEQSLMPYAENREKVGVFSWAKPDSEIEIKFATAYGVNVDVTVDPPKLVFDPAPPDPPLPTSDDVDIILNIIKGVS